MAPIRLLFGRYRLVNRIYILVMHNAMKPHQSNNHLESWPEFEISSWKGFIRILEFLELEKNYLSHYAFRGQADSSWTLKSSIHRLMNKYSLDRKTGGGFELTAFREFTTKAHIFEDFKIKEFKDGRIFLNFSIMQHYGVPTRLLDWTSSPYVALFFAVNSDFDKDGAVYLFHQTKLNDINKAEGFANDDNFLADNESDHIQTLMTNFYSKRANSQQGLFSIASNIDKDHYDLIQKCLKTENTETGSYYSKLIISKSVKLEFLARLRVLNIRADTLFPDLYGFGASIKDLLEIRGNSRNPKS